MVKRDRLIKIFIAGKLFALLLTAFQIFYFIAFSHLAEFETGIQFLNLFRYDAFIPSGFGPFMGWLIPHLLTLTVILTFFWWDWGNNDVTKWIAIGTVIGLTIMSSIWFASIFPFFMWIFLIYLILRLPPKAIRKLFNLMRKKEERSAELRKLVKKIPTWTQLFGILLIIPLFIPSIPYIRGDIEPETPYIWDLTYNTGSNFTERKEYIENITLTNNPNGFEAQLINAMNGDPIVESIFNIDSILNNIVEDGGDFLLTRLLRLLYLNNATDVLSSETRSELKTAVLYGKFWTDQPGETTGIYTTENHQIGYHTSELLAGQLFRNETFTRTLMTGDEHVAHAEHMINKWIDWRARFGFSEYHSGTYINVDFKALLNLVDFAENATIRLKAAMLLDLLNFDFANNYFNEVYAVAQGRMYGGDRVAEVVGSMQGRDSVSDSVWIWLGIGGIDDWVGSSEGFILTSDYTPSPILEKIANDAIDYNEHKDRNGMGVDEGALYGVEYNEEDLMYWWGMSNFLSPEIIETSFNYIDAYGIDQAIIFGPGVMEYTRFASKFRGITISEFSELMSEFTVGITQETANSYTYRTPHYQLSGLQDHQKGKNAVQEFMWQASLSNDAYVFTNAPGGLNWKGGPFIGGWMPRSVFHKNIGIIQYDHRHEILGGRVLAGVADSGLNMFTGNRPRNHAYFPKWAFEEVVQKGRWTFGSENGGYVALFSKNPTFWANDYELVSLGKNNVWIVEMGSEDEYASFEDFITQIRNADVKIRTRGMGYTVSYNSPSQGLATVGWEGDFVVDGSIIDLDYERFENEYVISADFNSTETIFEFEGERLTLNFSNNTRLYEP
ncbi:MAG: hypothetical protein ACTSRD_09550 [Promethearchaeota archaeon]